MFGGKAITYFRNPKQPSPHIRAVVPVVDQRLFHVLIRHSPEGDFTFSKAKYGFGWVGDKAIDEDEARRCAPDLVAKAYEIQQHYERNGQPMALRPEHRARLQKHGIG